MDKNSIISSKMIITTVMIIFLMKISLIQTTRRIERIDRIQPMKFFHDCGNGEITYLRLGDCYHDVSECFVQVNSTFKLQYELLSNQNTSKMIANMTIIEVLTHHHKVNFCQDYPDMFTCPLIKGYQYKRSFNVDLSGYFIEPKRNITFPYIGVPMLPVEMKINLEGDHGQIACIRLNFKLTG